MNSGILSPAEMRHQESEAFPLAEVVSSLSFALDLTEGQPEGHCARSCLIALGLAQELGLRRSERTDLFYAMMLKDLGCSSNAADMSQFFAADDRLVKQRIKTVDWSSCYPGLCFLASNVAPDAGLVERAVLLAKRTVHAASASRAFIQTRCNRGAEIALLLGLSEASADTIRNLDEHFDGQGHPLGLAGAQIPLLARIANLAQTVEVFLHAYGLESALSMARERSRRWFDPELVRLLEKLGRDRSFWRLLNGDAAAAVIGLLEPEDQMVLAGPDQLDRITEGFARVIDAKSPWTYRHSLGVAEHAVGIGQALGLDAAALQRLRRGALLHDIGKLGVSSRILDKAGPLDDDERRLMREHALFSLRILARISPFADLAGWASAHHERLDGSGYPFGLTGEQMRPEARILAVADVCQAITEERPYRPARPAEAALEILRGDAGIGVCGNSVDALEIYLAKTGF